MSWLYSAPPAPRAGPGRPIAAAVAGAATGAALLALAAVRPAAAQTDFYNTDAGRPITVEDAYTVERRAVEIQLAPLRLARARGGRYQWGLEPEVAIGLLPRTQLEVGLPLAFVDRGPDGVTGHASIDLSVLHTLNVETAIPALAVAADLLLPAGADGPARAYASVKGIATRTLSWARFHVNGQYTFGERVPIDTTPDAVSAELARWQAGVAVDRTFPLRSLLATGELVVRRPLGLDEAVEWSTGGGVRYQVSPRLAGDIGAGYRLTGVDQGWYATVGAALAVGVPWGR